MKYVVVFIEDPEVKYITVQEWNSEPCPQKGVQGILMSVPEDDTLQEDIEDVTRRLDDILSGAMVPLTDPMFAKINRIRVRFDLESFA